MRRRISIPGALILTALSYLSAFWIIHFGDYLTFRLGALLHARHFAGLAPVMAGHLALFILASVGPSSFFHRRPRVLALPAAAWLLSILLLLLTDPGMVSIEYHALLLFLVIETIILGILDLSPPERVDFRPLLEPLLLTVVVAAKFLLPIASGDVPIETTVWPVEDIHLSASIAFAAAIAAAAFTAAHITFSGGRARTAFLGLVSLAVGAAVLVDSVYIRYYGLLPSFIMFGAAGQAGTVIDAIPPLLRTRDLLLFADLPVWILILLKGRWTGSGIPPVIAAAVPILFIPYLLGLHHSSMENFRSFALEETRIPVRTGGLPGYHLFDLARTLRSDEEIPVERIDEIHRFFLARRELRDISARSAPYFASGEGMNLVFVMVESLQDFVLDLEIGGREITPNLNRFAAEALRFEPFFDETNRGATSDASFAYLNSLMPLPTEPTALRHAGNDFRALPSILAEEGYHTLASCAFRPDFWEQRRLFPRYGFETSVWDRDFEDGEMIGLGLADEAFFLQTASRLHETPEPFMAFLITLSSHTPYDIPEEYRDLDLGDLEGTLTGDYLHSVHYTDRAFGSFLVRLDELGLSDHTVIAVAGDHDAGLSGEAEYRRLIGISETGGVEAGEMVELADRVPFIVHLPAGPAGIIEEACGHIDAAPTLLAVLGITGTKDFFLGRIPGAEAGDTLPFALNRRGTTVLGGIRRLPSGRIARLGPAAGSVEESRRRAELLLSISDEIIRGNLVSSLTSRDDER